MKIMPALQIRGPIILYFSNYTPKCYRLGPVSDSSGAVWLNQSSRSLNKTTYPIPRKFISHGGPHNSATVESPIPKITFIINFGRESKFTLTRSLSIFIVPFKFSPIGTSVYTVAMFGTLKPRAAVAGSIRIFRLALSLWETVNPCPTISTSISKDINPFATELSCFPASDVIIEFFSSAILFYGPRLRGETGDTRNYRVFLRAKFKILANVRQVGYHIV
mmetsp:Transcript_12614/g.24454  ORF Transcript_12614/g.24454 Transcript_12614/m.24454 type:complete len:220 (-) Transcript_12614:758-1417(-)